MSIILISTFRVFPVKLTTPRPISYYMERSTLLAAMWNTDGDPEEVAETVRERLVSGDLQLTGNFRNMPAEGWTKDADDEQ